MGYLPEFTGENSFIEGSSATVNIQSKPVTKPLSEGMAERVLPESQRDMPLLRDKILISEDEDLIAWERLTRAFLFKLATGRPHRISAVIVWEWATGMSVKEEWEKKNSVVYSSDLRYINRVLTAYFGESRPSFIAGRKFNKVYDINKYFYLDRKSPFTMTLYLEWKSGLKVR